MGFNQAGNTGIGKSAINRSGARRVGWSGAFVLGANSPVAPAGFALRMTSDGQPYLDAQGNYVLVVQ